MAIGGALRAALKAGDFVQAAVQSRRAARALSELNASGGIRGTGERFVPSSEEFAQRGFTTRMTPPFNTPGEANLPLNNFGVSEAYFPSPLTRGRASARKIFVNPETGARSTYNQNLLESGFEPIRTRPNPIQAPYEGFRTFPRSGYNEPSPFMGRGRAPSFRDVAEPRNYGDGFDFFAEPFVFDPLGNNSFMNVPRAFGGNPGMGPAPRKRSPRPAGLRSFFFDDFSY